MRQGLAHAALLAALLLVGAVAWALALRAPLRVDATPLAGLPQRIGDWQGREVPLESAVESMLRADYNVQRLYGDPLGDSVWLYLGYYGTDRGGRPEHTPAACYRSHGWRIEAERVLEVPGVPGLRVNEYRVEKAGARQLVHFWFRSYRRTGMLGGLDQTADRLVGRLFEGRADGSLVRLSTGLEGLDEVEARSRLLRFAAELEPALGAHWPTEAAERS